MHHQCGLNSSKLVVKVIVLGILCVYMLEFFSPCFFHLLRGLHDECELQKIRFWQLQQCPHIREHFHDLSNVRRYSIEANQQCEAAFDVEWTNFGKEFHFLSEECQLLFGSFIMNKSS